MIRFRVMKESCSPMRTVLMLAIVLAMTTGDRSGRVEAQARQPQSSPGVSLSPTIIQEGQTVAMSASGFTPNAHVLMHLVRPDGTEYPEMQFTADARGEITHTIRIILILTGTYELQAIDLTSRKVVSSRFMVVEGVLPAGGKPLSNRTPASYAGVWQGTIVGPGIPQPRAVLITLTGGETGGVVGTIAYPALACGGELWLIRVAADSVQLGEHITYGEERCTTHGIVTARVAADGGLDIRRIETHQPAAPPAVGVLPRRL